MKYASIWLAGSALLLVSCGREEPVSYQVPKSSAPQAQPQGRDTDSQAVQAAHAAMSAHLPSGPEFHADLPEGWKEMQGSGMRKISYSIEGTSIDFYLISLAMGDVPSNVNRWRGQVGLSTATEEEIAADIQKFTVDGHGTSYIEIYNAEEGKGIIAAIIDLSPKYWYFTAKGSVDELKEKSAEIRAFLESITFKGHSH
jgi:hypothetical protein